MLRACMEERTPASSKLGKKRVPTRLSASHGETGGP